MSDRTANDGTTHRPSKWRRCAWGICGIALVGLMCMTGVQGYMRSMGHPVGESVFLRIALGVAGGVIYCVGIVARPRRRIAWGDVAIMLVVAAAMRAPFWSIPREPLSDCTRYLWDGAVTASGVSPYRYAPADVAQGGPADSLLIEVTPKARELLDEINYPHLRTIYPPVAQALFAVAYWIAPLELTGWRVVLLAFDGLAGMLVLMLLRRTGLPLAWWIVYLWNPLLIYETYGACHLDIIAAAMVILFVWALVRRRAILGAVALALGVGVKLWPVLLIFFLHHAAGKNRRKLVLSLGIFVALVGLMGMETRCLSAAEQAGVAPSKRPQRRMGRALHRQGDRYARPRGVGGMVGLEENG